MSTPGQASVLGSPTIYGKLDFGPTFGYVYRPLNQKTIVAAAGTYTVQPFDQIIIVKKTVPASASIQLPDLDLWMSQPYGGLDLAIKDGAFNASTYPIGIKPFGATQTIDGLAAASIPALGYTLNMDGAWLVVSPLADKTGWIVL